jgi:two-component system response regulator YesN
VRSKFYEGSNRIILASDLIEPCQSGEFDFHELMRRVSLLTEEDGGSDGIRQLVEDQFGAESPCPIHLVKRFVYSMLSIFQIILSERNLKPEHILGAESHLWEEAEFLETIQDIETWLDRALSHVRGTLREIENTRYHKIIQDLKDTVDTHYGDIENIQQAVNPLHISASYANHLFKKETDMTIFEYLTRRRIEVAKEMLKDPYCRISEIAQKVGYKSVSYFSALFKERTGQTPKQYTNRIAGQ